MENLESRFKSSYLIDRTLHVLQYTLIITYTTMKSTLRCATTIVTQS